MCDAGASESLGVKPDYINPVQKRNAIGGAGSATGTQGRASGGGVAFNEEPVQPVPTITGRAVRPNQSIPSFIIPTGFGFSTNQPNGAPTPQGFAFTGRLPAGSIGR